ncbi:hypothetical protein E2C01_017702 [Portunus trituberculatus]|uniref:Uncharacterized protein n=1 Tax=Portunus trituberculatus TaxID=210409 RepID=A0A5B7DUI9_PORTR|nr:hypothetical protein [Portunus trituberculatus]
MASLVVEPQYNAKRGPERMQKRVVMIMFGPSHALTALDLILQPAGGLPLTGGEGGVEESACTISGVSVIPSSHKPPASVPRALRRGSQSIAVRLLFSSAMAEVWGGDGDRGYLWYVGMVKDRLTLEVTRSVGGKREGMRLVQLGHGRNIGVEMVTM